MQHLYWTRKGPTDAGDSNAIKYLETRGYRLTRDFFWERPVPHRPETEEEASAIGYLFAEWDYGGVIGIDR